MKPVGQQVKMRRRALGMTQVELAKRAGVGLRFLRELERGKETVRCDRVNMVLALFGQQLGVIPITIEESRS